MSLFNNKVDTYITIYESANVSTGFNSIYKTIVHPATGNKIQGFQFDKRNWTSKIEENLTGEEPVGWDPNSNNIKDKFQSGIGDAEDLLVVKINETVDSAWSPVLNHGFYYIKDKEYYLYSDESLYHRVNAYSKFTSPLHGNVGGSYITLDFIPKAGVPILARSFQWDEDISSYKIDKSIFCSSSFTQKASDEILPTKVGDEYIWNNIQQETFECVLQDDLKVIFNKEAYSEVGTCVGDLVSYTTVDLDNTELVGTTNGVDNQEFHLKWAPIASDALVQILLDDGTGGPLIEAFITTEFTDTPSDPEVIIDYDLGIIKFGTSALNNIPATGLTVRAHYTKTFCVEYEPEFASDLAKNGFESTSPITKYSPNGFVFIKEQINIPSEVQLEADLSLLSENYYGPLLMGNTFSKVFATVIDTNGNTMEGEEVFFELLQGPSSASLGSDNTSSAFTNSNGIATSLFNPPRTIDDMGGATDAITVTSGLTEMFIEGYFPPSDESSLFLFQVHAEDNILGIPKSELITFYEEFIQEQGSLDSQTLGPLVAEDISTLGDYDWIISTYADLIKWEVLFRAYNNLLTPTTYEEGDLTTGKKTVVVELDSEAVNPHTGTTSAFAPVQPSAFIISNTGTTVRFNTELPTIGSLYKSYMIVGPTKSTLRAYVINPKTGEKIYSNTIEILVDLNSVSSGAVYIETINSIPSSLLNNSNFWDSETEGLENISLSETSGLLPIGFRLKDTNTSIASALDSITFLDINPLTSPDDTIDHEFEVTIE